MVALAAAGPLADGLVKRADGHCVASDSQICVVNGESHVCDNVSTRTLLQVLTVELICWLHRMPSALVVVLIVRTELRFRLTLTYALKPFPM